MKAREALSKAKDRAQGKQSAPVSKRGFRRRQTLRCRACGRDYVRSEKTPPCPSCGEHLFDVAIQR